MGNKKPINIEGEYWDAQQIMKNSKDYDVQVVIVAQNFCRGYEYALQSGQKCKPIEPVNPTKDQVSIPSESCIWELLVDYGMNEKHADRCVKDITAKYTLSSQYKDELLKD